MRRDGDRVMERSNSVRIRFFSLRRVMNQSTGTSIGGISRLRIGWNCPWLASTATGDEERLFLPTDGGLLRTHQVRLVWPLDLSSH